MRKPLEQIAEELAQLAVQLRLHGLEDAAANVNDAVNAIIWMAQSTQSASSAESAEGAEEEAL